MNMTAIEAKYPTIPLAKLQPGEKAKGGSINSRKAAAPIDSLVRSIQQHGLLLPLIVRNGGAPDTYYVIAGNRRLAALRKLHPDNKCDVPCIINDSGVALELSMVENVERAALHPVDQFEVFATLVENGETVEAIAKRYGTKIERVRQALALGKLAPAIRDAWRDGDIGAEEAEAFALTSDHKAQLAALKRAGKHPNAYQIRQALMHGRAEDVSGLLKIVGREAYEKAGHQINESLFSEDDRNAVTVSDLPALRRMADDLLEAKCKSLVEKDGWKWAILKSDAPNDHYAWKRVVSEHYTAEQRAALGCVVAFAYHGGTIDVTRGYVKPGDKGVSLPKSPKQKKAEAKARAEKKEESGGLSDALSFRLSQQLTAAVREAFVEGASKTDALAFAIAALACSESPFRISMHTVDDEHRYDNDFAKYFKLAAGNSIPQQLELLATWVAKSIDLSAHRASDLVALLRPKKDDDVSVKLLYDKTSGKALTQALKKHFDLADYLNSVSKDMIVEAVDQALGKEHAARVAKMKSAEAKDYAVKNMAKSGWLPAVLKGE